MIGYQFVQLGKMMEAIKKGVDPKEAYEKNVGTYGRFAEAAPNTLIRATSNPILSKMR